MNNHDSTDQNLVGEDNAQEVLASLWSRFVASVIDSVILIAVSVITYSIVMGPEFFDEDILENPTLLQDIALSIFSMTLFFLTNLGLLMSTGQTIGKKLIGIKIVSMDCENLSFFKNILPRYSVYFILGAIPVIGRFLVLINAAFIFRDDRRCVHDHAGNTKVIQLQQAKHENSEPKKSIPIIIKIMPVVAILVLILMYTGHIRPNTTNFPPPSQMTTLSPPSQTAEWYDEITLLFMLGFLNNLTANPDKLAACKPNTLRTAYEDEFIREMQLAAFNSVLDYSLNKKGIIQEWTANINIFRVGRDLNPFFIALITESQYSNSKKIIEKDLLDSTAKLKITDSINEQINKKKFLEMIREAGLDDKSKLDHKILEEYPDHSMIRLAATVPFSCAIYEMVMESNSTGGKIIVDYTSTLLEASAANDETFYRDIIKKINKN